MAWAVFKDDLAFCSQWMNQDGHVRLTILQKKAQPFSDSFVLPPFLTKGGDEESKTVPHFSQLRR